MTQEQIRKTILAFRNKLPRQKILDLSDQMISRFLCSSYFQQIQQIRGVRVGLYCSLTSEVCLKSLYLLFKQWRKKLGWVISFPRIIYLSDFEDLLDESPVKVDGLCRLPVEKIEFAIIEDDTYWNQGRYGFQEPNWQCKPIDELDLIFVPGVVFGEGGERIGMGKGFYDRFFASESKAIRIAFAFSFQVYPTLKQNFWDQRVDWIVTENQEFLTDRVLEKLK